MNGDIVGLSVLHSLSLVCGVLLLAFNVYVIVYEKDDRSDRRKTVPMRWRTITAASFSCGIHITSLCGVVEGIYQTSEVGERPVGLCEFQVKYNNNVIYSSITPVTAAATEGHVCS